MPSVKPAVVQLKVPKNQKLYNSFVIIFSEKTCSAENEKFLLVFCDLKRIFPQQLFETFVF